MKRRATRKFGPPIEVRSLSRAPINELGVVYLFGVLHDAFDFKIESVQSRFPDCLAKRQISPDRWEELRIEFEYKSKSFVQHKHDPEQVDMIVCWKHDWTGCPEYIEVIELSSMLGDIENIAEEIKKPKQLSAWQKFAQEKRLEGLSFKEIAELWQERKDKAKSKKTRSEKPLSEYQQFLRDKIAEGKTFQESAKLWRKMKRKQ